MKPFVVLAAGGTGGHINAAIAMGERLEAKGFKTGYLTGQRPLDYKLFKGFPARHLASWPLRTKNPIKFLNSLARNLFVFVSLVLSFLKERPRFVVGAGGYVCGPTLLAARILGIPVFIFEQNAVLGLTNRLLAPLSSLVFTHFKETRKLPSWLSRKIKVVGNPTRQAIAYTPHRVLDDTLRVLVFGGSLGASQVNQVIEDLVRRGSNFKMEIIHQTGTDSHPNWPAGANISYVAHKYLDNIQNQYAWCDVLVTRAGASTVSELRIIAKPAFLIPFPQATDNHQWWNALQFKQEGVAPVEVVEPRMPREEIGRHLEAFLAKAARGELRPSQPGTPTIDSSEEALREIFHHVGLNG